MVTSPFAREEKRAALHTVADRANTCIAVRRQPAEFADDLRASRISCKGGDMRGSFPRGLGDTYFGAGRLSLGATAVISEWRVLARRRWASGRPTSPLSQLRTTTRLNARKDRSMSRI